MNTRPKSPFRTSLGAAMCALLYLSASQGMQAQTLQQQLAQYLYTDESLRNSAEFNESVKALAAGIWTSSNLVVLETDLRDALSATDPVVNERACRLIALIAVSSPMKVLHRKLFLRLREPLELLTTSEAASVRAEALKSLTLIASSEDETKLRTFIAMRLTDESDDVRLAAARSLSALTVPTRAMTEMILSRLELEAGLRVRRQLIAELVRCQKSQAVDDALVQATRDAWVRDIALSVLEARAAAGLTPKERVAEALR